MTPYDELPLDTDNHLGPRVIILTDQQIDAIAERVEDRFYKRVGRKVVEKALWVIGIGCAALFAYLAGQK